MNQGKQLPKISVITPSLNQGRYLRQCIESVLSQDYSNLEFLIVDGGSSDDTLSVIKEYESGIGYWVSEPDSGQSDAINKGFKRASGELVAWLNADDYYLPGAFDRVIDAYRSDPSAPFYFGDGLRVDETGKVISNFFPPGTLIFDRQALVMGLNYILQPSTFINRRSLEQAGYLDTGLHYGMDSDLWMRLSGIGAPRAVNFVISATREYATTKTASGSFARVEELRQISMRHSGLQMTPGVLCYLLDTLYRFAPQNEDVFPADYLADIVALWKKTQNLLERFNARPDGFPIRNRQVASIAEGGSKGTALKIGIDLRQLIIEASGGISQLIKGVCEHMFALHPEHQYFVFCTPFNRRLLDYDAGHVHHFSLPVPAYFQNLDGIAKEKGLHVLFRAYPAEFDTLQFPLCKQIFLIPDNQHETFPDFFTPDTLRSRRVAFSRALGGAGAIGTISEFARKALQDYPGTRCKDIFLMEPSLQVVHERGPSEADLGDEEKQLIPAGEFFLFPANLWKHKNHRRTFEAFRLLSGKKDRQIELILTGHPSGWAELSREFTDLPIRHLGFVRPQLLRALLERARALVFFSLYEGFGIPLLEAFDAGTPVICSNTTSLPEVGGDAVLMCSPTDIEAMSMLMERILADEKLRASLIERGKARLKKYSWEKSARNLIAACERVNDLDGTHEPLNADCRQPLPLVSIVTPSFNQGRFLRQTIESVLSQSYPNIEYVVMDGGSTDESLEILRSYGDRFDWVSEKDKGQTDAINKGMARVNGEILAYLNSDDVLLPGAIERVVGFFKQHPGCGLLYGNADYIDAENQYIGPYKTAPYSFERLMQDCMVCQPAAFWRRSVAEKVGPFDDRLNFVMDYDYWIRIAKSGAEVCFIPEKLACSRLYPETKTLSARSKIYDEIFRISREHAGYIHQSYYQGYWHHRIFEKSSPITSLMRFVPGAHLTLGWLHCKWDRRKSYTWKHVAAFIRRRAIGVLTTLGIKAMLLREIARYRAFFGRKKTVTGFYADNWIADKLIIAPRKHAAGQTLYIAGTAPQNTIMTVYAGKKAIKQHELLAHAYSKAEFPSESVDNETVIINFSNITSDSAGRRLAFLLQDTNIFTEQDTW